MEKYKVALYATVAAALWGTSFPITKLALYDVSPITLAFFRYLIASTLFFPIVFCQKYKYDFDLKKMVLLGFSGITLPILLQNYGLLYTSSYITGFIQSTGPVYTIILAFIFLHESMTKYKIFGITLSIAGLLFITSPEGNGTVYGNVLVLLSAISYSISGVIAKNMF